MASTSELHDVPMSAAASTEMDGGLRRAAISGRARVSRTQVVLVVGPPGYVQLGYGRTYAYSELVLAKVLLFS